MAKGFIDHVACISVFQLNKRSADHATHDAITTNAQSIETFQLTPERFSVRSGRRLTVHVKTSARRYSWRLGHRHGNARGKVLRLRAPSTPGTYRLVVSENGHATTAVVRVQK